MNEAADPEFVQAFCARVRAARIARGFGQADVARVLEISRSAYQRYETRRPLPRHLVEEFAAITGVNIAALFGIPGENRAGLIRPAAPTPGAGKDRPLTGVAGSCRAALCLGCVLRALAVLQGAASARHSGASLGYLAAS